MPPARVLWPLGLGTALSLLGDATLYTVLPIHAADAGVTLTAVGILLGANRAIRLFLNGPAGLAYDRWPRRRLFDRGLRPRECGHDAPWSPCGGQWCRRSSPAPLTRSAQSQLVEAGHCLLPRAGRVIGLVNLDPVDRIRDKLLDREVVRSLEGRHRDRRRPGVLFRRSPSPAAPVAGARPLLRPPRPRGVAAPGFATSDDAIATPGRSGRRVTVASIARSRRQAAIAAWLPESSTGGTPTPSSRSGRV